MSRHLKLLFVGLLTTAVTSAAPVLAQGYSVTSPPLTITNDPIPDDLKNRVYAPPPSYPDITPSDVTGALYFEPTETVVGRKINELSNELFDLQSDIAALSGTLNGLEQNNIQTAAKYYSAVATINTQLQAGTTRGNPRLIERIGVAQNALDDLSINIGRLNDLGLTVKELGSAASFLLESARATYALSGAVEEDHVNLAELEDNISSNIVFIERLLNNTNDAIIRSTSYMNSERNNIRTLALAVTNGDLYGRSLANRPFSSARLFEASVSPSAPFMAPEVEQSPIEDGFMQAPSTPQTQASPSGPRPLVRIRFDQDDVNYEQPVYVAVNEVMQRFPEARLDLVAVSVDSGNNAENAIQSTRARRKAEEVLRSLTQMGLDAGKIDLSYTSDSAIRDNEVRIYVR